MDDLINIVYQYVDLFTLGEHILVVSNLLLLVGVSLVLFRFRQLRKYIGSLSEDSMRVTKIQPELIQVWLKTIKGLSPGTRKWEAYRASLEKAGLNADGNRLRK